MTIGTVYGMNSTIVKPQKPLVHSWSSLGQYRNCPWQFYLTRVAKTVTERQSPQMAEGNERHRVLEVGVRDGLPPPPKYAKDQPVINMMRAASGTKLIEWQFGLNRNWQITKFFGDDVWIRGKIDIGILGNETAAIFDYKTGKRKPDTEQLQMFALPVYAAYPYLKRVDTAYLWLEEPVNKIDKETFVPEQLPEIREKFAYWIAQVDDSVKRGVWPKQTSGLCREYCPVGRANCEYCGS
jgi:hypothetical protein